MKNIVKTLILLFLIIVIYEKVDGQDKTVAIPGSSEAIQLVKVKGGNYYMRPGLSIELPSFFIGKYEVTWDQFTIFQEIENDAKASNNKHLDYQVDAIARPTPQYEDFSKGMGQKGGYPMVSITQQAALEFCKWLYMKTGVFFRLPTEAEWEYSCQKGKTDKTNLTEVAYYYENAFEAFHKTGEKSPNQLGVFDLLGNVAEWTADGWTEEKITTAENGNWVIPSSRYFRVVKGGSYLSGKDECTCQFREKSSPRWQVRDPQIPKSIWWNTDAPFIGFRVVVPTKKYSHKEIMGYYEKAIVD